MFRFLYSAALAVLVLGNVAVNLRSEEKKDAAPKAEAKKITPPLAGGVTPEQLEERLNKLGFKPQRIDGSPTNAVNFKISRGTWDFNFHAGLNGTGKNVLLVVALTVLPESENLRADILEKILRSNDKIGPAHFVCDAQRRLYLVRSLSNHDVTAGKLRREIDSLMNTVLSTESLWNPKKYPSLEIPSAK